MRVRTAGVESLKALSGAIGKVRDAAKQAEKSRLEGLGATRDSRGRLRDNQGRFLTGAEKAQAQGGGRLSQFASWASNRKGAQSFAAEANQAAEGLGRVRAAGTAVLRKPIEDFIAFDHAMAGVRSKMDEVSSQDFARLKRTAQEAGAATGFASVDAAQGLEELAASGLSAQQQMAALPNVLKLAAGGQVEVARASAITVNTMAQFGLKSTEVGRIGDVLLGAANASTIGLNEIAETLKYVGPVASAAGLSLESTAKFTALLGNSGIEASSAGTALRGMIASLAAPSGRAKKALAEVGMSTKELATGVKDPIALLKLLSERFNAKNFDSTKRLGVLMRVFGREVAPAVQSMIDGSSKIGEDGQTGFQKVSNAINNSKGALERANAIMQETAGAKLAKLRASIDKTSTQIGELWTPTVLAGAEGVGRLSTKIADWAAGNPQAATMLGRTTAAVVIATGAMQAFTLASGAAALFGSNIAVGARLAFWPLIRVGALATEAAAAFNILSIQANIAGASTASAGLRMGALAIQFAALAGAAWAGYEAGTALDGMLGKLAGARGGKLSTEAALQAGESDWFNDVASHIPGLREAAAANKKRNQDEKAAAANGYGGDSVGAPAAPGVTPATGGFNAVTGQIEVTVKDDRIAIKTISRGKVGLRTGQNAGAPQ